MTECLSERQWRSVATLITHLRPNHGFVRTVNVRNDLANSDEPEHPVECAHQAEAESRSRMHVILLRLASGKPVRDDRRALASKEVAKVFAEAQWLLEERDCDEFTRLIPDESGWPQHMWSSLASFGRHSRWFMSIAARFLEGFGSTEIDAVKDEIREYFFGNAETLSMNARRTILEALCNAFPVSVTGHLPMWVLAEAA